MIQVRLLKSNYFLTTHIMASALNTATEYNTPTTATTMVAAIPYAYGVYGSPR